MQKAIFYITFYVLFFLIEIFNWIGLFCDELFYRSYKKVNIIAPVFIIGMPRSATTFLYNTLSEDTDRFTCMKLWEIIFAPSVTQKKIFISLFKLDRFLNGFFLKSIKKMDKKIFQRFENIHHISLFNVEEDEYTLMHRLSSPLLVFIFPKWEQIRSLIKFDQNLKEKRKKQIMAYYRKQVQKHMYVFAPHKTYLSKSPSHTSKLNSLKNTFPACKFIYTLRIPEECISSAIGMYKVYNRVFHTNAKVEALAEVTLDFADLLYAYTGVIDGMDEDTAMLLKYDDITKNPEISITKLYKAFGFRMSESFRTRLVQNDKKAKSYKSNHAHSLENSGVKIPDVRDRFRKIYDIYFPEYVT